MQLEREFHLGQFGQYHTKYHFHCMNFLTWQAIMKQDLSNFEHANALDEYYSLIMVLFITNLPISNQSSYFYTQLCHVYQEYLLLKKL